MRQISLVGAVDEEVGNYFPEFLGMLDGSPFLQVRRDGDRGGAKSSVDSSAAAFCKFDHILVLLQGLDFQLQFSS